MPPYSAKQSRLVYVGKPVPYQPEIYSPQNTVLYKRANIPWMNSWPTPARMFIDTLSLYSGAKSCRILRKKNEALDLALCYRSDSIKAQIAQRGTKTRYTRTRTPASIFSKIQWTLVKNLGRTLGFENLVQYMCSLWNPHRSFSFFVSISQKCSKRTFGIYLMSFNPSYLSTRSGRKEHEERISI